MSVSQSVSPPIGGQTPSRSPSSERPDASSPPPSSSPLPAPPPQRFCLKWNNYQSNVTTTFKELLAEEDFVDITLSCEGGATIKAHKVVLSACSPYFRNILKGIQSWQHPVIVLKDVIFQDLQGIVEFIYHGEVSVFQDSLSSFLRTAQLLRVKGLTEESSSSNGRTDGGAATKSPTQTISPASPRPHPRKNSRPLKAVLPSSGVGCSEPSLNVEDGDEGESIDGEPKAKRVAVSVNCDDADPLSHLSLSGLNNRESAHEDESEAEIDDVEEDIEEEEEEEVAPYGLLSATGTSPTSVAVSLSSTLNPQLISFDKRQRQQLVMQGGDMTMSNLDPDLISQSMGIPSLKLLGGVGSNGPPPNGGNNPEVTGSNPSALAAATAVANAMQAVAAARQHNQSANMPTPHQLNTGDVVASCGDSSNANLYEGMGNSGGPKKTCPYCYQQLSWHALSRHIRDMHRAKTGLVTCKYCMKTFRNKNSLGCHMWRFHKDMKEKEQHSSTSNLAEQGDTPTTLANPSNNQEQIHPSVPISILASSQFATASVKQDSTHT